MEALNKVLDTDERPAYVVGETKKQNLEDFLNTMREKGYRLASLHYQEQEILECFVVLEYVGEVI